MYRMKFPRSASTFLLLLVLTLTGSGSARAELPIRAGAFEQQVHDPFTEADGLPPGSIKRLALGEEGGVYALSDAGKASRFDGTVWSGDADGALFGPNPSHDGLESLGIDPSAVRDVARHEEEIAVAAEDGLYLGGGAGWTLALPQAGETRWAPVDVRAVGYDSQGRLWFAAPQGVGYRVEDGKWELFTGSEGLPFNDFTCMASGPSGVWFGTTNGAIQYQEGQWHFRQEGVGLSIIT